MDYQRFGSKIVARIDRGEEIVQKLNDIVKMEGVLLGGVQAIGAVDKIVIGLFDTRRKEYLKTTLEGEFEIIALLGNISTMAGEHYLHLHITVADDTNRAYGGHLNEAYVSGTCEVIIDVIEGQVDREFSKEVGLNLYEFK